MVSIRGVDVKVGRIFAVIGLVVCGALLYIFYGSGRSTTNPLTIPDGKGLQLSLAIKLPHASCKVTYIDNQLSDGKLAVVLMHGAKFNHTNWIEIKTIEKLTEWKYRAIALNMKDAEKNCLNDKTASVEVMKQIFDQLIVDKFIVVSPSKSGQLSIPYLLSERTDMWKMSGFVPIATVIDPKYQDKTSGKTDIPICYIYGSRDDGLGKMGKKFFEDRARFPQATINEIHKAGHACYIDNPNEWHEKLKEFLSGIAAKL